MIALKWLPRPLRRRIAIRWADRAVRDIPAREPRHGTMYFDEFDRVERDWLLDLPVLREPASGTALTFCDGYAIFLSVGASVTGAWHEFCTHAQAIQLQRDGTEPAVDLAEARLDLLEQIDQYRLSIQAEEGVELAPFEPREGWGSPPEGMPQ